MQSFLAMTVFESNSYRKFEVCELGTLSRGGFVLALIMAAVSIVSPLLALTSSLRMANSRPSSNKIRPAMQDVVISAGGGHYSHSGKNLLSTKALGVERVEPQLAGSASVVGYVRDGRARG
jgi:hypothetical protein